MYVAKCIEADGTIHESFSTVAKVARHRLRKQMLAYNYLWIAIDVRHEPKSYGQWHA